MTNTHDATRRTAAPSNPPDDADRLLDDGLASSGDEGTDSLAEETGLDLSEASGLDADNVPADEESSRIVHAPD